MPQQYGCDTLNKILYLLGCQGQAKPETERRKSDNGCQAINPVLRQHRAQPLSSARTERLIVTGKKLSAFAERENYARQDDKKLASLPLFPVPAERKAKTGMEKCRKDSKISFNPLTWSI